MSKATKDLLEFWEDQLKLSHTSSNYFFRKSPSHYHMMLLVMTAYKLNQNLSKNKIKSILLPVSAPFHCSLMKLAAEKMKDILKRIDFNANLSKDFSLALGSFGTT